MVELIADVFLTVDGSAAGTESGPYFGYGGPDLDAWIEAELAYDQTLVMGRVTYQLLAGIGRELADANSRRMTELPKMVFSTTLTEPLSWANSQRVIAEDAAAVDALKDAAQSPMRVIGSLTLVRNLVTLGVLDRLRIMIFPQVLGVTGREPAFAAYPDVDLELTHTQTLDGRVVLLDYCVSYRAN